MRDGWEDPVPIWRPDRALLGLNESRGIRQNVNKKTEPGLGYGAAGPSRRQRKTQHPYAPARPGVIALLPTSSIALDVELALLRPAVSWLV